jgi:S-adenosylmethionine:tRNA ribosyltransferase-isomerase
MKLSEFDYKLPPDLIAQYPLQQRDNCRLLVIDRSGKKIYHKRFCDIPDYLKKNDLLILNNTKVLPARLIGKKKMTGGKVDILLLESKKPSKFRCLIKPCDIKINETIIFDNGRLQAKVTGRGVVEFNSSDLNLIYSCGRMPLPPYIKRMPQKKDEIYYQTVFATKPGAIASPTAGLHFSARLLARLRAAGVKVCFISLHINYATFRPVREEEISRHKMYKEYYEIPSQTLSLLKKTRKEIGRILAVGTTSCRVLETIANLTARGELPTTNYCSGYTDLFIYPGYKFKMTDCLLTNFHLPRTTLLLLVCAFAGRDLIMQAYQEAIERRYRFYSYGDAMLII